MSIGGHPLSPQNFCTSYRQLVCFWRRIRSCADVVIFLRSVAHRSVCLQSGFASAAPPVRYPNVYGIDMPAAHELVAHGRTEQEVCEIIGADRLFYQTLEDLVQAVKHAHAAIREFDNSCFSGEYVTGDVTPEYLERLERERSDKAKTAREATRPDKPRALGVI